MNPKIGVRVPILTPDLSISLKGLDTRFDDLATAGFGRDKKPKTGCIPVQPVF